MAIRLLRPEDVAEILNVSKRTLEAWRHHNTGPRFYRLSHNCIRYRLVDIEDWVKKTAELDTEEDGFEISGDINEKRQTEG
jgi:predicted DNA-binding transcriptional regulator AlpA